MTRLELTDWEARSPTVAAMLNPSLIAAILSAAVDQYAVRDSKHMPWELSHVIVPLVLHEPTRRALPQTVRTNLVAWVGENRIHLAGLGQRGRALAPHVREGLRFGIRMGAFEVTAAGLLSGEFHGNAQKITIGDTAEIVRAAGLLGRWFSLTDDSTTVYKLLGVSP